MARGKQDVLVPGPHRDVGKHVRRVPGQHRKAILGDLLLPGDAVAHEDARKGEGEVHAGVQLLRLEDLGALQHRLCGGRDDLPRAKLGQGPKGRLQHGHHQRNGERGTPAHNLLGEELNCPSIAVRAGSDGLCDGLQILSHAAAEVAHRPLHPVHHGGHQQGVLLGQSRIRLEVRGKVLPGLEAVAELRVVPCAEAQVLQKGLHQLGSARPAARIRPEVPRGGLSAGPNLGLECGVQVEAVPRLPPVVLSVVERAHIVQNGPGLNGAPDEGPGGLTVYRAPPRLAQDVTHLRLELVVGVDDVVALRGRCLQVRATMYALQGPQIVPEVVDQALPLVRKVLGLAPDGPVEALQPLPGQACLTEDPPIHVSVPPALKEADVSLADRDVVWRSVVVKLLMPLLHPRPLDLLHLVPVHDVEDVVPDLLAVRAALADAAQAHPGPLLGGTVVSGLPDGSGECQGEVLLRPRENSGLCVVVPLPCQLPHARVPQPDEEGAEPPCPVPSKVPVHHPPDEVRTAVEAVHEGHVIPALPVHNVVHKGVI
mmetsp:Transcript_9102/g.31338  ORF Transcript_9102/g.31338 Transcript_9102/m.31338 type:complete len:540 (+) Transcript_9102:3220-4839(+)